MTIRIDALLGVARIPMQIDVGFGDVILPPATRAEFPVLLDHPAPVVEAIQVFLWPLLCAVRDAVPFTQMWKPGGPWTPEAE